MAITTGPDPLHSVKDKWLRAEELSTAGSSAFAAVMVCLALDEVASQLGRIADVLQVRLK